MLDLLGWMLLYILFLVSVIFTFLTYDCYKEWKSKK